MVRYRVKIDITKSGNSFYTPQVGKVSIKGKYFKNLFTSWENIIGDSPTTFYSSPRMREYYSTELEALDIIEKYKKHIEWEDFKIVKETTYKEVK
jgi:hypothetical protein